MHHGQPHPSLYHAHELPIRPDRHPSQVFGRAALMNESEFTKLSASAKATHGSVQLPLTALVERSADDPSLTPMVMSSLWLTPEQLDTHLCCIGQTGDGKSLRLMAPMYYSLLRQTDRRIVILNTKGRAVSRLLVALARRTRRDTKLGIVNFRDARRSLRWNPVARPKADLAVQTFTTALHTAAARPGKFDSPFWRNGSIELITGVLEVVDSLKELYRVLRLPVNEFRSWAAAYPQHAELRRFADYLGSGSHNAETILQDAAVALSQCGIVADCVQQITAGVSEFDSTAFVRGEALDVLILELDEADAAVCKPLVTLLLREIMDAAIREADSSVSGRLKTPLALLIDEFASSVGQIEGLAVKINTLRSRGASIIVATQSIGQISQTYGEEALPLLAGFRTLVTIGQLCDEDREYVARKSGTMTASITTTTDRFDPIKGAWVPDSRTTSPHARALIIPGDLVRAPHTVFGPLSVIMLPNQPPLLAHLAAAWEIPAIEASMEESRADGTDLDLLRPVPSKQPLARPVDPVLFAEEKLEEIRVAFAKLQPAAHRKVEEDPAARLEALKSRIGATASEGALGFWRSLEVDHTQPELLALAEELARREVSLHWFAIAAKHSRSRSIGVNLAFVDYLRAKSEQLKADRLKRLAGAAEGAARDPIMPCDAERSSFRFVEPLRCEACGVRIDHTVDRTHPDFDPDSPICARCFLDVEDE